MVLRRRSSPHPLHDVTRAYAPERRNDETAGISDTDGSMAVEFWATKIAVGIRTNRTCTGQVAISTTAKNGTLQLTDASGLFGPGAHGWEWSH